MRINLLSDSIPLPIHDSADSRRRHHGEEFTPLAVSFVERGGFVTNSDRSRDAEMKLPRWESSPMSYRVHNDGSVWGRHLTQYRLHKVADSVEEWKFDYLRQQEKYLERSGYTLQDVFD